MRKCNVKFYTVNNEVLWKCPNNMGYQTPRKLIANKCWKANCPGRCELKQESICSYELCQNLRRPGSKYCDDKCRKLRANRNYKLRLKSRKRNNESL